MSLLLKDLKETSGALTALQDLQSDLSICSSRIETANQKLFIGDNIDDYPDQTIQWLLKETKLSYKQVHYLWSTDIMNALRTYPWFLPASMIYDYEFRVWTKLGSGTINQEFNHEYNGAVEFVSSGVQCTYFDRDNAWPGWMALFGVDYADSSDRTFNGDYTAHICEFQITIPNDATNKWLLGFYTSLTASGGTGQPFIGIFWWGASNANQIGIRRRTSAGGTVTDAKSTITFTDGINSGRFLYLHSPQFGEYLYYYDNGTWTEIAKITKKTTLNLKHMRVSANFSSNVAAYTTTFHDFKLYSYDSCVIENNVPKFLGGRYEISSWIRIGNYNTAPDWESFLNTQFYDQVVAIVT